ncbi:MAG: CpsD/CapB family tyrosine-protein kinase [Pseudomonadota bacterium]
MDKSRNTMKLNRTQEIDEAEKTVQPSSPEQSKQRRESLIEAAMDFALREVSHLEETREPTVNRQRQSQVDVEMKAEVHPALDPVHKSPAHTYIRPNEKEMPMVGISLKAEASISACDAPEDYEKLRAHFYTRYPGDAMKVILFIGVSSGSGISTAAANFAATVAQDADSKVLLIDANFRSGKHQSDDDAWNETGEPTSLSKLLAEPSPVWPAPGPSNLYVLPRGVSSTMPLSLFQSENYDRLLDRVRQHFRYVIVDGPALQGHPEALVLSRKADGVILVIESEATRKRTALWAKEQIEAAGGAVLGAVLNKRKYYIPDWLYKYI